MTNKLMNSQEFLTLTRPALEARDANQLAAIVNKNWDCRQLCWLLERGDADSRKVVCIALGLVGERPCNPCLTNALRDEDPQVGRLAEHALWSIWFRMGNDESQPFFKRGMDALQAENYSDAMKWFNKTLEIDPDHVEAYNQRGIVEYMIEDWEAGLRSCQSAVKRAPTHFGAWAGMGHCYAQLGEMVEAADCYRKALSIHPRMEAVAGALERIEDRLTAV